jgi:S1-C subfamily serine protease
VQAGFGTGAGWQDQLEGHQHGWLRSLRDLALYLETGVVSQRFFSLWHCDLGMFLAESFAGLRVTEVSPGGWAAEAGVQAGDRVLYVDGLPIFERTDLWPFQIAGRPGDRLTIEVARNGSRVRGKGELRGIATAR